MRTAAWVLLLVVLGSVAMEARFVEAPMEPVVLIPGVVGSVLYYADANTTESLGLAWLRLFGGALASSLAQHLHRSRLVLTLLSLTLTLSLPLSCRR